MFKRLFQISSICLAGFIVQGCSTNAATGQRQFTALMSPQQENQVGAQEHQKILQQYGLYQDQKLQNYISEIGQKVVQDTERPDVKYQFFLLDSPIVNAFALPGGYIYLTRGLMALSNSESEMAAVLAHEAGHITGRHSAERYSRSVATSIGATILSAAIGSSGVSEALGVGTQLYLSSYSRGQESEADSLGLRYLSRSGYAPDAMAGFLKNLQAESALQASLAGAQASQGTNFFSTHPATGQRVAETTAEGHQYGQEGLVNRDKYLNIISGMVYGDSAKQGFIRGQKFLHPQLGFKFSVPNGYRLTNGATQIVAKHQNGNLIIFDMVGNKKQLSPARFIGDVWLKGQGGANIQSTKINGMNAAYTAVQSSSNGRTVNVQLVAIQWSQTQVVRFQAVTGTNASSQQLADIKSSVNSYKRLSQSEKASLKPYRLKLVRSKTSDTVATLANKMAYTDNQQKRFRVLNGLGPSEKIVANRLYKIVSK